MIVHNHNPRSTRSAFSVHAARREARGGARLGVRGGARRLRLPVLVRSLYALALLVMFCGCDREPAAELLSVDAVVPGEAQFGDSVQILGDGFGLSSPASVTLRGEVYRAGRAPQAIERAFRAQTESQRELALTLPREAEAAFCGEPDEASHATFRGDVTVAIAAHTVGAPPATGTLHGVVLELYPAVKARTTSDRLAALGRDLLAFVGLDVAAAHDGGLTVLSVAPGSRASAAELRPGDRIARAGNLSVFSPGDLVPDAARQVELGVMRDELEHSLLLDVDGFVPTPPAALAGPALLVLAFAAWLIIGATPLTSAFGWVGQNWVEQERARRRSLSRESTSLVRRSEWPRGLTLLGGASGLLVWLGVAAALCAPVLRRAPVDVATGLLALMFVSAALLGAAAFGEGGAARERWSMRRAFAAVFCQWWVTTPAWLAVLAPCFESGVDLEDLVRAQGPWPWSWNAFGNPGSLLACSALLATTLPRPGSATWLSHARPPRLSWRGEGGWLDRLYLCSASAVATLVFLGGDAWPGAGGLLPAAYAAMLLVVKYTLVVLGVSFLRGLCLGLTAWHWSRLTTRAILPAALGALLLAHGFRVAAGSSPLWGWVASGVGPASVAVVVLGAALLVWRSSQSASESAPPALSPWL
jgi:NADH-quinone oxidoreductase subunit H